MLLLLVSLTFQVEPHHDSYHGEIRGPIYQIMYVDSLEEAVDIINRYIVFGSLSNIL